MEEVDKRIEQLKNSIEQTSSLEEATTLQKRVSRLASGVAVIRVGGSTEVEMIERKHRIEDALEAVKSAQEEGVVPGGGTALLRACKKIAMVTHSQDQAMAAVIIRAACSEPIRQMASNAGESPDLIVSQVESAGDDFGWDFISGKIVNLLDAGIIDPVKVTRCALTNAVSCAGTLITTNFGIIQTENR